MKVLIAGSTGYLGRFVVREFKLVTHIPTWLARAAIGAMRIFDRHAADLFEFFATAGRYENVAPSFGTHTLDEYFRELSRQPTSP